MSVTNERILRTMRGIAWERAKGELNSMLNTFWGGEAREDQFDKLNNEIDNFIKTVEDDGLNE